MVRKQEEEIFCEVLTLHLVASMLPLSHVAVFKNLLISRRAVPGFSRCSRTCCNNIGKTFISSLK